MDLCTKSIKYSLVLLAKSRRLLLQGSQNFCVLKVHTLSVYETLFNILNHLTPQSLKQIKLFVEFQFNKCRLTIILFLPFVFSVSATRLDFSEVPSLVWEKDLANTVLKGIRLQTWEKRKQNVTSVFSVTETFKTICLQFQQNYAWRLHNLLIKLSNCVWKITSWGLGL